jgi:glutaminase
MIDAPDLQAVVDAALDGGRAVTDQGKVATYIPALAEADPNHVGLAIRTIDGAGAAAGDVDQPFTFQSVAKVFALCRVFGERGLSALDGISVEPSGDSFHSIVKLEEEHGRPRNPYINAGAIMVSGRLPGDTPEEKAATLQAFLSDICDGEAFPVDEAVYRSESATGYRNRALADFMKHYDLLDDPHRAAETYFRQCSITLTARRLARLGLFLANGGVDPVTGERAVDEGLNRTAVALMAMCGLYDEVGHFAVNVGVPAKSGVSGAILAVVPGRMSIAAFGPALGPQGNSVAAMTMLEHLAGALDLSLWG